jgi:hypothetical protein
VLASVDVLSTGSRYGKKSDTNTVEDWLHKLLGSWDRGTAETCRTEKIGSNLLRGRCESDHQREAVCLCSRVKFNEAQKLSLSPELAVLVTRRAYRHGNSVGACLC